VDVDSFAVVRGAKTDQAAASGGCGRFGLWVVEVLAGAGLKPARSFGQAVP